MKVFYSGVGKGTIEEDARLGAPRYRLFSCHGAYYKYALETTPRVAKLNGDFEIMLDSGAFTAWSKGEEVHLDKLIVDYGTVIEALPEEHRHKVWMINLDKIPGEKGRTATPREMSDAIRISDENYRILDRHFPGKILPVFHQNESDARLKEVAEMNDYICVSPRNDLGESYRFKWAVDVHAKIPGVRTHGLAATGISMMTRVPWHSVDSATWIAIAAYGGIFVNKRLRIRGISVESPTNRELDQHYTNLSDLEKELLDSQMKEWGLSFAELQTKFESRALWNRLMIESIARSITDVKVPLTVDGGLFPL